MNLEQILEEWKTDSVIDTFNLDATSIETAKMHGKYLELLAQTKMRLKQEEFKQKDLLKDKWMWFEGKMSKSEIDARGWKHDPFDGHHAGTKAFKEHYYETDEDLRKSEIRITTLQTQVETLKEILDTLKWRHQTIRNIIEIRKFQAGN